MKKTLSVLSVLSFIFCIGIVGMMGIQSAAQAETITGNGQAHETFHGISQSKVDGFTWEFTKATGFESTGIISDTRLDMAETSTTYGDGTCPQPCGFAALTHDEVFDFKSIKNTATKQSYWETTTTSTDLGMKSDFEARKLTADENGMILMGNNNCANNCHSEDIAPEGISWKKKGGEHTGNELSVSMDLDEYGGTGNGHTYFTTAITGRSALTTRIL